MTQMPILALKHLEEQTHFADTFGSYIFAMKMKDPLMSVIQVDKSCG